MERLIESFEFSFDENYKTNNDILLQKKRYYKCQIRFHLIGLLNHLYFKGEVSVLDHIHIMQN